MHYVFGRAPSHRKPGRQIDNILVHRRVRDHLVANFSAFDDLEFYPSGSIAVG